ncbi:MAG: hypothetical protein WCI55_11835 [Armatimonadota bacterium]
MTEAQGQTVIERLDTLLVLLTQMQKLGLYYLSAILWGVVLLVCLEVAQLIAGVAKRG